jgi:hypothetical protein
MRYGVLPLVLLLLLISQQQCCSQLCRPQQRMPLPPLLTSGTPTACSDRCCYRHWVVLWSVLRYGAPPLLLLLIPQQESCSQPCRLLLLLCIPMQSSPALPLTHPLLPADLLLLHLQLLQLLQRLLQGCAYLPLHLEPPADALLPLSLLLLHLPMT